MTTIDYTPALSDSSPACAHGMRAISVAPAAPWHDDAVASGYVPITLLVMGEAHADTFGNWACEATTSGIGRA